MRSHLVMIDLKQAIVSNTLLQAIALDDDRIKTGDRTPNIHTLVSCDRTSDDRFKTGDRTFDNRFKTGDRTPNIHTLVSCDRNSSNLHSFI
ncbi:hypothetical protein H6G81_28010 [Scytonema hofmannii FACHB-248]|uniref:Transposase n=2 Tax=Scytonema hofmannii TaxID=34078 RepID=A0ABR8GZ17_9CYAN|nr:hypothetical protein [[Scytonema hofmanni] UTEX B 1581]MBD2608255.1 hypothetical protein [Scytonema hofmannii FACHB-248]